jgi:methylated-DNA-[protein]-cysteine S-methyltransferase
MPARHHIDAVRIISVMELAMPSLSIPSPVGPLTIEEQADKIVAISWSNGASRGNGSPLLDEAARQLAAYFEGRLSHFDLPLAPAGSPFEKRVWAAMQQIPYGETRCYGDLAAAIGSAPRAVGGACGRNPIPVVVPCHRVLAKGGMGGYSGQGGLDTKRALLRLEGALPAA